MCHPEPTPPFGFEAHYTDGNGPAPLSVFYGFKASKGTRTKVHRYVRDTGETSGRIILYQAIHFRDRWWIALPAGRYKLLREGTNAEIMGHLAAHLLTIKT